MAPVPAPRLRALLLPLLTLAVGAWGGGEGAEAGSKNQDPSGAELPPTPHDPDDTPFMPAPRNQLGQWSTGRERPLTPSYDDDHWVQLTVTPKYASLQVPLIGRPQTPFRGGGVGLELDIRALRWLFVRVYASHTVHPLFEETRFDEDSAETQILANSGALQVTNVGGALVYALDIGRFVPRVDVGGGAFFIGSPEAAQAGQRGGSCAQGGVCDLGLSCGVDEHCRPAPVAEVHAGLGLDILFGQRWSVGVDVRYFALITALSQLPVYLNAGIRLSARF